MRKRTRFLLWCGFTLLTAFSLFAQQPAPNGLLAANISVTDVQHTPARLSTTTNRTTYYDLGCKHQGWMGYFDPLRWYKTAAFGDGGVDVTEAPNATVAEGVTAARLEVQTGSSSIYTWRITVPADGYLYFRLEKVGSFLSPRVSSTDTDLQVIHNHETLPLKPLPDGGYFTPHLKAGDTFGVRFHGRNASFRWEELTFYSNSVGVLVTPPVTRSDGWTTDQVKPIPRANIDQVFFVNNDPEEWPTLDQDGDLYTLDDQISLSPGGPGSPFNIKYVDWVELRNGQYWIEREFTVEEPCSGNQLKVRRWWRPLPLLPPASPPAEEG